MRVTRGWWISWGASSANDNVAGLGQRCKSINALDVNTAQYCFPYLPHGPAENLAAVRRNQKNSIE